MTPITTKQLKLILFLILMFVYIRVYWLLLYKILPSDLILQGHDHLNHLLDRLRFVDALAGGGAGILFGDLNDSLLGGGKGSKGFAGTFGHELGPLFAIGGRAFNKVEFNWI